MVKAYIVYLMLMSTLVVIWRAKNQTTNEGRQIAHSGDPAILPMVASVILYGLLMGLRYDVGGDYLGYVFYYETNTESVQLFETTYELGFYWLIRILHFFDFPPAALFVATCTLQMLFMATWLERNRNIASWYIFFFFTTLLLFESLNIVRHALAATIFLAALPALHERRPFTYVILIVLATLIHKSAIILMPLYFILRHDWLPNRWLQATLLLFAFVSAPVLKDRLFEFLPWLASSADYDPYSNTQDDLFFKKEGVSYSPGMFFALIVDLFIIYSSQMLKKNYEKQGFAIYYNLYLVGALLGPIVLFSNYIPFSRMIFYFTTIKSVVLAFLVIGWLSTNQGRKRSGGIPLTIAIIVAYVVWFLMAIWNEAAHCSPFLFVWD